MNASRFQVERLGTCADEDIRQLAELLVDAVESGAAVSFMQPLDLAVAEKWWRETVAGSPPRAIILVARDSHGIAGSVQMQPAWAPNQPHRGEICKLIVHRRIRGAGLGERLMHGIESAARDAGFKLLTLDAKEGGAAVRLYRKLGWIAAGMIPDFALDPDGAAMHGTVILYKRLGG